MPSLEEEKYKIGVNIDSILLLMMKKLDYGDVKFVTYPYRVTEDMLLKFKDFVSLVDFIILDKEEDVDFPIILCRIFLLTSRTYIYLETCEFML